MPQNQDTLLQQLEPGIPHALHRIQLPGDRFNRVPGYDPSLNLPKKLVDAILPTGKRTDPLPDGGIQSCQHIHLHRNCPSSSDGALHVHFVSANRVIKHPSSRELELIAKENLNLRAEVSLLGLFKLCHGPPSGTSAIDDLVESIPNRTGTSLPEIGLLQKPGMNLAQSACFIANNGHNPPMDPSPIQSKP